MMTFLTIVRVLTCAFVMVSSSIAAHSTGNCTYGPHEFVIIGKGNSPNHRYSIRAHGNGGIGLNNFHVYLYAEPSHKRIGPLEEVNDVLGTCAGAFTAAWSPDSKHVAVHWRHSHQDSASVLYRIANQRAYPIDLPDVEDAVAGRLRVSERVFPEDNECTWVKWLTTNKFLVVLTCTGIAEKNKTQLYRAREYVDVDESREMAPEQQEDFVGEFSGVAIYEYTEGSKYRLVSVRPVHDTDYK